jgi:transcriptional regulator MraZ
LVFRGNFEHTLDAKHRLTIPAKFRSALAAGVVLAVSPETQPGSAKSIAIWPTDSFEQYTGEVLAGHNPISPRARELRRVLFNNSHDTELDAANRVMIPPSMLRYAGLDREVVVTGSGECLEVWDRGTHAAYNDDVLSRFPEIAASVGDTA